MRYSPAVLISLIIIITSAPVFSQGAGEEASSEEEAQPEGPVLTPPSLLEYAQADYPAQAFESGLEAEVLTKIDIDENGVVTGVNVEEPAGHGFDEAATEAIYRFVFKAATSDGEAVASQVFYRYTFFITEKEPEAEDISPPVARLSGRVNDMDGEAIPGASVIFVSPDDVEDKDVTITTDDDGFFDFGEITPGEYSVEILATGFKPLAVTEDLAQDETREVVYRLEIEAAMYETVVRGRRPPREVTRREITRREITRIPGTGGDAMRSVQNMPGMARAPGLSGELIVRGSSPGDSRYFFDQMPVPMLYHFGGLTSVINSDLLERIDFYPGNYSVRYGGATGGIVDVYPRAPATDRIHASLDADIWDISALVETPLGEDWSVAVSGRRSYIDGILNAVLPEDGGMQFTVAPRYYDYQLVADYHPDDDDNLRLFLFGSDDKMVFLFGDDVIGNPNFGGGMEFRTYFHQLQIRWDHHFSSDLTNEFNIGSGLWGSDSKFGENFKFVVKQVPIFLRDEIAWNTGPYFIIRTGIDMEIDWARWSIRAPMDIPSEGEHMDPITANSETMETSGDDWFFRPAWYGELEMTAIDRLRMIYGLRVDYFSTVEKVGLDPRFVARYQLFDWTTLKGGVGLFHQPPTQAQSDDQFGNPDLGLIGAVHYSVGVEQNITENIEIGLEGFYKDIYDLVVSSSENVERDGETVPERYNNDGDGAVYGLELMVKHQPTDRFFGWIAYTLMKSKRIDHPGWDERPFDYDQTHILTVVASVVLGRGWEAGVRFRLVTGNPNTPVVGTVYDSDSDIYWPMYGETNSTRLPMFHQLDVRVDKNWQFKHVKFGVYIDVQNVYNQKNVEGYAYSYDYSEKVYFHGLPILPSLGLKIEY